MTLGFVSWACITAVTNGKVAPIDSLCNHMGQKTWRWRANWPPSKPALLKALTHLCKSRCTFRWSQRRQVGHHGAAAREWGVCPAETWRIAIAHLADSHHQNGKMVKWWQKSGGAKTKDWSLPQCKSLIPETCSTRGWLDR